MFCDKVNLVALKIFEIIFEPFWEAYLFLLLIKVYKILTENFCTSSKLFLDLVRSMIDKKLG